MLETLSLTLLEFLALSVAGLAALAPVRAPLRRKLLPAAPVFGAALVAVVTNWTCRWLSIRASLPIIAAVVLGLFAWGLLKRTQPFRFPRRALAVVALGLVGSIAGLVMAATPIAATHDTDAVAPTYIIDQFYFAGVSTYMLDHPLLPGPTMTKRWVGNDPPATAPAADTVANRIRFGQSAVAAVLSAVVFQTPYRTVGSIGLLWFVLLGLAVATCSSLLGMRKRATLAASILVTGSFFVVAQPLQGQNDGLLGTSLLLLALTLSLTLLKDTRSSWPLVLVGAGLAASYSEYFTLLAPALALLVLVGPWRGTIHRLNLIGGRWAMTAVLAPWAYVWLAESFKLASRFTDGPEPFVGRTGWALFRAYLGITTVHVDWPLNDILSGVAVAALLTACVGWYVVVRRHGARGVVIALLIAAIGFEAQAIHAHAGNLQFRVMQLSLPPLLLLAVAGWDLLLTNRRAARHAAPRFSAASLSGGVAALVGLLLIATNLTTVGLTMSLERARNQHVPAAFIDQLTSFVGRVGGAKVTVLAPNLTDEASISLALADDRAVDYAVILPVPYVGSAPHWNLEPDPYYVVTPGATVVGPATYLIRQGRYALVHLLRGGMIISPMYTASWPRVTWMRGFPCGSAQSSLVVIRGDGQPGTFRIATAGEEHAPQGVEVLDSPTQPLASVGTPSHWRNWTLQTFRAPSALISGIVVQPTAQPPGSVGFPLAFGSSTMTVPTPNGDAAVTDACYRGDDSGMDGYDRDLTFMRSRA